MTSPTELLASVESLGGKIKVACFAPPRLKLYIPAKKSSPELLAEIQAMKQELIDLLLDRVNSRALERSIEVPASTTNARLVMVNKHAQEIHDPDQCYMWTRAVRGYGWRYTTPPLN